MIAFIGRAAKTCSTLRSVVGGDHSRTVCLAENSYNTVSSHFIRVSIVRLCVLVIEKHDCLVRLSMGDLQSVGICGLVQFEVFPEWDCYAKLLGEIIRLVLGSCKLD